MEYRYNTEAGEQMLFVSILEAKKVAKIFRDNYLCGHVGEYNKKPTTRVKKIGNKYAIFFEQHNECCVRTRKSQGLGERFYSNTLNGKLIFGDECQHINKKRTFPKRYIALERKGWGYYKNAPFYRLSWRRILSGNPCFWTA